MTAGCLNVLYLTHDLSDPTTHKRVAMLQDGGASVTIAGFSRSAEPVGSIGGCPTVNLGQTYNGGFLQRTGAVVWQLLHPAKFRALFKTSDIVIARNIEMLALAVRGRSLCPRPPALVYECLDIHRLLLQNDFTGKALRRVEGWLAKHASLLITSSPAFISEYFNIYSEVRLPIRIVENKLYDPDHNPVAPQRKTAPPWRIGWFGAIRCRKSLSLLTELVQSSDGKIEVVIRGKPALDQFEDFYKSTSGVPGLEFLGPYKNPDDLDHIYGNVHFTWTIDMFEEGRNSSWLLPNRMYEGCAYGCVPIAQGDVETGQFLKNLGIGVLLDEPNENSLVKFFDRVSTISYRKLQAAVIDIPQETWVHSRKDCEDLVEFLGSLSIRPANSDLPGTHVYSLGHARNYILVVIPCLNEQSNIGRLVLQLLHSNQHLPMRIVIADGGSTDGSVEIAQKLAAQYQNVVYLNNSKRRQSAAINLAVEKYGSDAEFLIRIDAHSYYPDDYCDQLVEEAKVSQAASVVVTMYTEGKTLFQKAVATAQNSRLGNGGAAHRNSAAEGQLVEHGHHALMRIDSFKAIGGYDESFSHNEDAELDIRLGNEGYKIWLTAKTKLVYYPRSSPVALFKQYFSYGNGRVRTILKHRAYPKLRQIIPVAIAPAVILALAAPLYKAAIIPFAAWAFICIFYGVLLGNPLSGFAAMIMHLGWSLGFWRGAIFSPRYNRDESARFQKEHSKPSVVFSTFEPRPDGERINNIDIGICTFRRPHVADTLRSIAKLSLPPNSNIHVIVADNDDTPSARTLVENTARECALSCTYIHAPARNISIARNACLNASSAPLFAFIDDDELVTPGWLAAMLATMENSSAEVVLGPVHAIYDEESPEWMQKGDFHSATPVMVNNTVVTGYSCNVLMKRNAPAFSKLRFRTNLGRSGGEDTTYFAAVHKAGARIAYSPDAVVTEAVARERANFGWLLKRRFRSGQTHVLLLREDSSGVVTNIFKASAKILYCISCAVLNIFHTDRMAYWLLRGSLHAGVVAGLLGAGFVEPYGKNG